MTRAPFLLLAAMLVALAVLFAPGAQPAQAQQSFWSATLTVNNSGGCNHITGNNSCANRLTDTDFTYGGASYTIRFIDLDSGTLLIDLNKSVPDSLKNSGVELVVGGTKTLAFSDATLGNGVIVNNKNRLRWTSTGLSWTAGGTVTLSLTDSITMTAEFADGVTIANKEYQVGVDVNESYTSAHDQGLPRLPEVDVEFGVDAGKGQYKVDYTLEDLPAGLSMGTDRVIRGVPTEATTGAVTVTYTAAVTFYPALEEDQDQDDREALGTASASLTFTVTVTAAPPVTFSAEAQKFFAARTVVWVPGSGWRNNVLPAASGGTGTITYSLINNDTGAPLADGTPMTFNATTRTIGGTMWTGSSYAVTYIATDENGSTAQGHIQVRHSVGGV